MKKILCAILVLIMTLSVFVCCLSIGTSADGNITKSFSAMLIDGGTGMSQIDVDESQKLLTVDIISDTHIGASGASGVVRSCIQRIESESGSVDALIIPGDLTNGGDEPEFAEFYNILNTYSGSAIVANGNHDYGSFSSTDIHRPIALKYRNQYKGISSDKNYYSTDIKGCKVIVLGDEGNKPNSGTISREQLDYLRSEVAEGAKDGAPVFVIAHWPLRNTNGERFSWPIIPGGAFSKSTSDEILSILSAYPNVFYISGHLHAGLNGRLTRTILNACCVEKHNGVTCINAPSCGKSNHMGYFGKGTGMRMSVYKDRVIIEGRNYESGEWLTRYVYDVPLSVEPVIPGELPGPGTETDPVPATSSDADVSVSPVTPTDTGYEDLRPAA